MRPSPTGRQRDCESCCGSFPISNLTNIVVEQGNRVYDSRDNCNAIVETATNTLVRGCKNTIIPGSVTTIGDEAFNHCASLTSITIPGSVTTIGSFAFNHCASLTSITIPGSVTFVGEGAFYVCDNLKSIYLLCTPPNVNVGSSYAEVTKEKNLENCTLYVPQGSLAAYKAAGGWNIFKNIVEFDPSTL